jgi:PhnB protein
MISVNPYLLYKGTCAAAFNFYKIVFGGQRLYIGLYKDAPQEEKNSSRMQLMRMLCVLCCKSMEEKLSCEMRFRIFNELSIGGSIIVPVAATFWSACYGVVTDRFGIQWKVTSHGDPANT